MPVSVRWSAGCILNYFTKEVSFADRITSQGFISLPISSEEFLEIISAPDFIFKCISVQYPFRKCQNKKTKGHTFVPTLCVYNVTQEDPPMLHLLLFNINFIRVMQRVKRKNKRSMEISMVSLILWSAA
jgi:hypothetical protein